MTMQECVVNRILELCAQRNWAINRLAHESGLHPSTVKNIVNGISKNPGVVTIKRICDGLDMSLVEFFDSDIFRDAED